MKIDGVLKEFKNHASRLYGDRLKGIILYGSWARGEVTEDSDIDLAVVLDGEVVPGKEIDRMIDVITDINLDYGVLLSVYPVSEKAYEMVKSPFLMNMRVEGKLVWKKQ